MMEEREPAPERSAAYQLREKESYAIVIMEALIGLGREAGRDGLGEYYEDAVDSLANKVPSSEFINSRYVPGEALLRMMETYRSRLEEAGFGTLEPLPEKPSYLDLMLWLEELHPSTFIVEKSDPQTGKPMRATMHKTDPLAKYMNRIRTMMKERIIVDLLEDMGILRHRTWTSTQSKEDWSSVERELE